MSDKIKLAVVDGFHPYQVQQFHDLFRSMNDVEYNHMFFENWACNVPDPSQPKYDAVILYNMTMQLPPDGDHFRTHIDAALAQIGETETGLVIWHHAILSIPDRDDYSQLVGIPKREFGFHLNQEFTVNIANPDHPITKGLSDFKMIDETYTMMDPKPEDGNDILLKVDHDPSMEVLAWTRQHKNARIFCFQSGHDSQTWENPNFRTILHRGIQWAAGKL